MPKNKPTVFARAAEFSNEGFYVSGSKILMCKYCDCRLEFERKDTLNKHIQSVKHKNIKQRQQPAKRQLSIDEAGPMLKRAKLHKEEFVLETVEAFIAAGIPVEKLDNCKLREWLEKNVSGAGDIPSADWVRKKYIPLLREKKEAEIKEKLADQKVVILADETTDKGNNCVFNILFQILQPGAEHSILLGASCVLQAANAAACSKAVIDICTKYEVKEENVVAYVTDGARYMTRSASTLKGVFGDHVYHVQCWAHKINLIGQIWQNNLEDLNLFVIKVKNAFLNTRKRRHAYLNFLREKNEEDQVKMFPMPIVTRWNTWFHSVFYLAVHLRDIVCFFEQLSEENNAGVKFIKGLQEAEVQAIEVQCVFVTENCACFVDTINFLEGSSYPSAHLLYSKLQKLQISLEVLTKGIFSEAVEKLLTKMKNVQSAALKEQFKHTSQLSLLKLHDLLSSDPSHALFHDIDALLNPKNIGNMSIEDKKFSKMADTLPFLKSVPKTEVAAGYMALQKLVNSELQKPHIANVDIVNLLCTLKCDFAQFAAAALKLMWIPTSNVDTERSFSKYSVVVSDRRRSLLPENAELLTMVAFS